MYVITFSILIESLIGKYSKSLNVQSKSVSIYLIMLRIPVRCSTFPEVVGSKPACNANTDPEREEEREIKEVEGFLLV